MPSFGSEKLSKIKLVKCYRKISEFKASFKSKFQDSQDYTVKEAMENRKLVK